MSIKQAIFALESVAHLQGRERELLPICDAARAEHEVLLGALREIVANDPYKQSSAGIIARRALAKVAGEAS